MTTHDATGTAAPGAGPTARHKSAAESDRPEGAVSAAVMAAGVGAAALGIFTVLAEASETVGEWFAWSDQVGGLSGKTGLAVIVWLVAWAALHLGLRGKAWPLNRSLLISLVLIVVGVLGTLPPIFQSFEG